MSKFSVTSPLATKSNSPVTPALPQQQGFQLEPSFGELDAPSFGLELDGIVEPDSQPLLNSDNKLVDEAVAESRDSVVKSEGIGTDGELVQDVSESTAIMLALDEKTSDPTPDSFFASSWPYFMVALAFVGWVVYQRYFLKPAPSFKHHKIPERQQTTEGPTFSGEFKVSQRFQNSKIEGEVESEIEVKSEAEVSEAEVIPATDEVTSPKKTGQFKPSQRFRKPKSEAEIKREAVAEREAEARARMEVEVENIADEPTGPKKTGQFKIAKRFQKPKSEVEIKTATGEQKEAPAMNSDRPADDEFDLEFGGNISDSDVIDQQEAAEIVARVDARQAGGVRGPSARFKAEIGEKEALPKDRV